MIRIRKAKVIKIIRQDKSVDEVWVELDGTEQKAINYRQLSGPINVGDEVLLNTTAVYKKLGTGGAHFVIANFNMENMDMPEAGHIMKMRYTPMQVKCFVVEEEDSPYHDALEQSYGLANTPVVIAELHSMLPAIVVAIKKRYPELRVAYVMTDGGALPMQYSKTVKQLKAFNLLEKTISVGHAFGGDYEAINVYSGLLAAKEIAQADVIIVCMGPGIVGTNSKWGFTGLEQAEAINAVNTLGGQAVMVPRISFTDPRERHQGISHHTITVLNEAARSKATIALPGLPAEKMSRIVGQLVNAGGILEKHDLAYVSYREASRTLMAMVNDYSIRVKTMGRTMDEEREFFLTAASAGLVAGRMAEENRREKEYE